MNKRHVPVTDMTTGQVIDAIINNTDAFYYSEKRVFLTQTYSDKVERSDRWLLPVMVIHGILITGQLSREVETPWTDQLDGTWKNGVWCMVWDEGVGNKVFAKVTEIEVERVHPFRAEGTQCNFNSAIPLSENLASQLEALSKEQSK